MANNSRQEETKRKLDELLQSLLKAKGVEEAVAAIESGDGSFKWYCAAGKGEPGSIGIGVDTPFWIASITKLYIAAAVLKLQEQKLLKIDYSLNKYLPPALVAGLHCSKDGIDRSDQITVRHLLSHTSGLPEYIEIKPKGGKSIFELVLEEGDRAWSISDSLQIVKDAKSPLFEPQPLEKEIKKARYSDTNFQLLIAIVEALTGNSIDTVFREMFYKPLKLSRTFHPGAAPLDPDTPEPLPVRYGNSVLNIPLAMKSFGDLYSTIADQLVFMRALKSGSLFADPQTSELMHSGWNRFGFMISPIAPGWPIEYGHGMMRFEIPRFATPFKAIPAVTGHTGAIGSWLFYCPSNDYYLTGSVNQLEGAAAPFRFIPKALNLISSYCHIA
ncbi:MAG: serine hydrolase domain-containing protein [Dethiobacteria bacterium]|nr:serine hydrolase domain-containing protein [Dethiobacteria bacterium]